MNIRLFFFFKDILDKFILPVGVGTVTIPKKMYGEDFDLFFYICTKYVDIVVRRPSLNLALAF